MNGQETQVPAPLAIECQLNIPGSRMPLHALSNASERANLRSRIDVIAQDVEPPFASEIEDLITAADNLDAEPNSSP